jgi:acetyl esterase/lipase
MKKRVVFGLVLWAALVQSPAAETAAAAVTNAEELLPVSSPYGEARAIRNLAYTTNATPRQNFDLYLPVTGKKPFPLIVWIHGGAWMMGIKEWDNVKYLVKHGYAIATIDYRTSVEAPFPVQIRDCNTALNFILAHAAEYGVQSRPFVIGGGSAGGHLALLLGLAREQADFGADPTIKPAAILDFFGPADFLKMKDDLEAIHSAKGLQTFEDAVPKLMGAPWPLDAAKVKNASPVTYITTNSPPVLILQGGRDDMVPRAQSQRLHAVLDQAGVPNRYIEVAGAGHDGPRFSTLEVETNVVEFLGGILKQPSAQH